MHVKTSQTNTGQSKDIENYVTAPLFPEGYFLELVRIVALSKHYMYQLILLELRLLFPCNLEAVSVTKIGSQIRAEDVLHSIKCEI